jgi:hypothetical protein
MLYIDLFFAGLIIVICVVALIIVVIGEIKYRTTDSQTRKDLDSMAAARKVRAKLNNRDIWN